MKEKKRKGIAFEVFKEVKCSSAKWKQVEVIEMTWKGNEIQNFVVEAKKKKTSQ